MIIDEIHIYGYGKLENIVIKNLNHIQVFFGENEAGKSTIMSFLHSILFGFPTKLQSDLRYEPKTHTKYGGKLVIKHPIEGQVVIERVKGKATGDVMVKFEDGSTGGEELLSKLMKKLDKGMFQSIYSFNLNGLQNIHQVKSEDLGKFLFSTGAVGTDKLLKVENELKKELETRFKPGGARPALNVKLKELQELHTKVKEAQNKNDSYSTFIQKRMVLDESIKSAQIEMRDLLYKINRMNEWKNYYSYVQEVSALNQELQQTSSTPFPTDGLNRFENIMKLIKPLEAQIAGIVDKQNRLNEQISLISVDEELLKYEVEIENAIAKVPVYDQLTIELSEIKNQLKSYEIKLRELKEKLYYEMEEQSLLNIDTSIFMKEKIVQAHSKLFRLNDQKQLLDNRFHEEQTVLEGIEKEILFLEEQVLTDQERDLLLQKCGQANSQENLKRDLKDVQEKIDFHRTTKKITISESIMSKKQTSFLLLFFVFLTLWTGLNKYWFLFSVVGASLLLFTYFTFKKLQQNSSVSNDELLRKLIEKERQLMSEISSFDGGDKEHYEARIQQDDRLQNQLHSSKLRWSQQHIRFEQIIQSYEKWESEYKVHEKLLEEILKSLNLPANIPFDNLSDAFQILTEMKELKLACIAQIERQNQVEVALAAIHSRIYVLANQFITEKKATIVEMVFSLKENVKKAHQQFLQNETNLQKLAEIEADRETIIKEHLYLQEEIRQLFADAGVENEEQFRSKAKEELRRANQTERLQALIQQINMAGFSLEDYQEYPNLTQLINQIEDWNHTYNHLEELVTKQQNDLADINYQISLLEEGGLYTELFHRYKHKKYELEEHARTWGAYAVAKQLLSKTIERYRNEKLPSLLTKAEEYLNFLTIGEYVRIHAKDEGSGFLIERRDHTFFEANELSQATMEQVYVSIRLSLATTLFEKNKFPIVIDDSFVNFDQKRTERIIELLKNLTDHQILFFTCHSHMLPYFSENQIIKLEKKA